MVKSNSCRFLWGEPEGKRALGRLKSRWEDIKLNLREKG
jgi:hypothetical protein